MGILNLKYDLFLNMNSFHALLQLENNFIIKLKFSILICNNSKSIMLLNIVDIYFHNLRNYTIYRDRILVSFQKGNKCHLFPI